MLNQIDIQKIELNTKSKDELIISLLIALIAKTEVAIKQIFKTKLMIEYGSNLTDEIVNTKLQKADKKFAEIQYGLLADLILKYSSINKSDTHYNSEEKK